MLNEGIHLVHERWKRDLELQLQRIEHLAIRLLGMRGKEWIHLN